MKSKYDRRGKVRRPRPGRKCHECKSPLNSWNKYGYCSICLGKMSIRKRMRMGELMDPRPALRQTSSRGLIKKMRVDETQEGP